MDNINHLFKEKKLGIFMKEEYINLLTLKKFYKVQSDKTGQMFMDKDFNCYLFEKKSDAQAYMSEITDISIVNADIPRPTIFCDELYIYGFKNIRVFTDSKFVDIPISSTKRPCQLTMYNPESDGNILRLKQTCKKKYLSSLYNSTFYSPVLITDRMVGKHPVLHYLYAEYSNSKYYVLFSSIKAFNDWNSKREEDWKPLETNIARFERIRMKNPIIINPDTDKILISNEFIKYIMEAKKNAEREERKSVPQNSEV